MLTLFSQCGGNGKSNTNNPTTHCHDAINYFGAKQREITWDEELETGKVKETKRPIKDEFYDKYLRNIREFKKDEFTELYYHSIPDLQTNNCWVVIERILKISNYHTYYLVDLSNQIILVDLASFEDYPDGKKRAKSVFLDDRILKKTEILEYLGDYDDQINKNEIVTDSLTYLFTVE